MNTYSIALRLRRVTHEDAYIAVPVTDAIMKPKPDGSMGIDPAALWAEGIRVGQDSRVEWHVESAHTEPHPTQQAAPEDRKKFDAFYDEPLPPSHPMIADRATAETLFKAAFDAYCGVDAALSRIAPDLSPDELTATKRAVGKVMGEILFQITEPILKTHPELLPDAWNDAPEAGQH